MFVPKKGLALWFLKNKIMSTKEKEHSAFDGGKTPEQVAAKQTKTEHVAVPSKPGVEPETPVREPEAYPVTEPIQENIGSKAMEAIANPTNHGGVCIIKEKGAELIDVVASVAASLGQDFESAKTKIMEAILSITHKVHS